MSTAFQSDSPAAFLNTVPTSRLPMKVEAFKALFGTLLQGQTVKVKGAFKDAQGTDVFLREMRLVDMKRSRRYWLCVAVDGEWQMIRAERDIIESVLIEAAKH